MTNPYGAFDGGNNDYGQQSQEPQPQSYAEYQQAKENPQAQANFSQAPGFDPFQPHPQAGMPAPYGQQAMMRPPGEPKSWVVTLLLTAFLGNWGAHNFYLGYRNRAITQLLFTVIGWVTAIFIVGFILLGVVAVWAFIDFIRVLLRSGEYGFDSSGRPLK